MIAFQNKDVGERFIHTIMMHGRYSRHRFAALDRSQINVNVVLHLHFKCLLYHASVILKAGHLCCWLSN